MGGSHSKVRGAHTAAEAALLKRLRRGVPGAALPHAAQLQAFVPWKVAAAAAAGNTSTHATEQGAILFLDIKVWHAAGSPTKQTCELSPIFAVDGRDKLPIGGTGV